MVKNAGSKPMLAKSDGDVPAHFARQPKAAGDRADFGLNLKRIRMDQGLTLEQASRRTDVSRSTLSKIENGQMSPTYDVLQKITSGMDIDIVDLFESRRHNVPFGRRSLTRAGQGRRHSTSAYLYEILSTDLSQKRMSPLKARIRARSLDDFDGWVRHDGEEFVCVLSGRIELFTEFYSPVVMEPGDCMYFDSKMGHALVSVSEEEAEVIWVCVGANGNLIGSAGRGR